MKVNDELPRVQANYKPGNVTKTCTRPPSGRRHVAGSTQLIFLADGVRGGMPSRKSHNLITLREFSCFKAFVPEVEVFNGSEAHNQPTEADRFSSGLVAPDVLKWVSAR